MPEDTFHALVGCQFAIKVRRLSRLANIVSNYPSINFSCFVQTLVDSLSKETFESFMALAWSIWRDKNLFLHNKRVNEMSSAVFWAESVIKSYQLAQHSSIGRVLPLKTIKTNNGLLHQTIGTSSTQMHPLNHQKAFVILALSLETQEGKLWQLQ